MLMFVQGHKLEQKVKSVWSYDQRLGQQHKTKFLALSPDFKFRQVTYFNKNKNLHIIQGQLVYNNGALVTLSISHQNMIDRILNAQFDESKQKIVFSIDSSRESLVYSAKVVGLPKQFCELWVRECEKEVVYKKNKIIHLLAVIGFQMDSQTQLMKKIILQKKVLHQKLEDLFARSKVQKIDLKIQEEMVNEMQENNVIFIGPKEQVNIWSDQQKISQEKYFFESQKSEQKTTQYQKKAEGGYFSIQSEDFIMSRRSQLWEKVTLCRKTLRSKKKLEEKTREMNRKKMKKEMEIVQRIKNKKYLIKYYCKRDLNNLDQILMEKYDYSLQEYINYFADSLEISHKITIAKQIIESVILLHASGVVHRDIKPSNFLISDSFNDRNHYKVKIIDFAQSYVDGLAYDGDYACSHPYSPLQCSEFRSNNSYQGIKNKEIDYWSVGMTVYQVFFRKLPLSFSRIFHLDIAASWKAELLLTVNQRQKYGLGVVQDIVTILCIKMLKIEQQKRMKLEIAMSILNLLQTYVKSLVKIVEEAQ